MTEQPSASELKYKNQVLTHSVVLENDGTRRDRLSIPVYSREDAFLNTPDMIEDPDRKIEAHHTVFERTSKPGTNRIVVRFTPPEDKSLVVELSSLTELLESPITVKIRKPSCNAQLEYGRDGGLKTVETDLGILTSNSKDSAFPRAVLNLADKHNEKIDIYPDIESEMGRSPVEVKLLQGDKVMKYNELTLKSSRDENLNKGKFLVTQRDKLLEIKYPVYLLNSDRAGVYTNGSGNWDSLINTVQSFTARFT